MLRHRQFAILAAGALACALPAAAQAAKPAPAPAAGKAAAVQPAYGTFGFDVAGMDRTVAPGEDFGRYASGTYLTNLVIPADRSNYGMFTKLRDLSQERTRTIIETAAAAKDVKPGSEAQKVGDFYGSFLDEAAIEAKGLAPLKPHLRLISAIADRRQLAQAFGQASRLGVTLPVGAGPQQDLKNPDIYAVYVGQGGLGLPDRDYYLDTKNPKFAEIRGKYVAHIAAMLRLAGVEGAEARAQKILALETKLAGIHWSKVEERQIEKLYNPIKRAAIDTTYPGLDWTSLLTAIGVQNEKELVILHPSAIAGTAKLIAEEPLDIWKDYLTFHVLKAASPYLPKAFVDEDFAFSGKVVSGQPEIQPRWKRGVDTTTAALGEAVGKLYVAKYFPPEAKREADLLVKNIIAAMDERLSRLTWMDPKTKAEARAKLAKFTPKIGYPATWRDYSRLEVRRGDALGNAFRAAEFAFQRELDKIGKPIDRTEWGMTPMTVNAYANPFWNEIVFPAAILQPPFFDAHADTAINYGGIGLVIGHEISHHFDDQGRKFDKDGKLSDWWTPEDVKRFTALTDKVVKQYAAYEPLPGTHVNGELTLGENMADLAGLCVSFDAYHKSLNGKPAPVIDGFTGDQRFFLGFAQVWRQKYRDASLLQQLTTNEHTPGFLRPNVVRNLDAWYDTFSVKPGQALYLKPEDRIKIW
ncbi:M13 family metallopeptidase [Geothrix sp. 21YS21S-4]|uniref:M13 family metallopeptidase n=1 Tax=Geothrix sp. 21YS21S-4 TaxID=3068889 RepID=UPI0027BB1933|nr:M13-type metalloendopeptidase [Geothrix sp. 21YS21S-4]